MANFFSRFRRQPATVNNANKNLETNVRAYVNSYLKNRNSPNKIPPLNAKIAVNLRKYINSKRARVAGAGAAAAGIAGATTPVQAAVAAHVANTPPSAPPSTAASNAARAAQRAGATPTQIVAAATGAAQAQAQMQRQSPNAVQQAGAEAAAQAALQGRPKATPAQQAQTAAAGAEAANGNAKRAALATLLSGVTNNNITSPNGKSIAEVEKLKANLEALNINNNRKTAVLRLINNRLRTNVADIGAGGSGGANINAIRGAVNQNTNVMNQAQAREELKRLNVLLGKVGQVNNANLQAKIHNYRRRLNVKVAGETGAAAPLALNINVPGSNTKVKVVRNNPGNNWRFANKVNNSRYNLNNKNKNVPKVRNISTGNMFSQKN